MQARVLATFLLLPLVLALERFAWYASRASLSWLLSERLDAGAVVDLGALFQRANTGAFLALLLAGVVAALLLPRITLVLGGVLAACGYALLGGAETLDEVRLGLDVLTAGSGALRASLFALAALVLPGSLQLRAAFVIVCMFMMNVGGFLGPLVYSGSLRIGGELLPYALSGALLVGTLVAAAVIAVDRVVALTAPVPAPARPGRAFLGACVLLPFSLPAVLVEASVTAPAPGELVGASAFMGATTLVTVASLAVLCLVLLAWRASRPFPWAGLIAAALALTMAAGLVLCSRPGWVGMGIAGLLVGLAEVASPLLLARAWMGHHPRLVTLVAGAWLALPLWGSAIDAEPFDLLLVSIGITAFGGVMATAVGRRFEVWLDEPRRPAPESWLNSFSSRSSI